MRPNFLTTLMAATAVVVSALGVVPGSAAPASADVLTGVTADYQMNEPSGSTVMLDDSGNGNHGTVDPSGVQTGATYDGATGYNWVFRSPTAPPASPERVVQVPDDIALEPGNQDFTIELRFRFTDKFGNIAQKGQAQTAGGQWKIQAPGGVPSCLFSGSAGQVATSAITPLDDGTWHTLTCTLTQTGVSLYVDGVYRNRKNGTTGVIDNDFPMTVGGKIECDQVSITCDYYTGQIDSLRITKGPNQAPSAAQSSSCPALTCAFDASASTDPDGEIAAYSWSFGDGTSGTGQDPTHIYASSGTYRVRLEVTDNRGGTDVQVRDITVEGQPVVSLVQHVATAVGIGSTGTPSVVVPASASVGDRLLLVATLNSTTPTYSSPQGVTGLALLGTNVAKTMPTTMWSKTLEAGDAGTRVTLPLSGGQAKYSFTAAVYSGVAPGPLAFGASTGLTNATTRLTPEVSGVADGSWVLSYWADKSTTTTGWTPSSAVTARGGGCGTSSGHICSRIADSAAKVPAVYGNIAATSNEPSSSATMWSVVLPTAGGEPPANQKPVAAFDSTCLDLSCAFDSADSTDPDGSIVERSWTFGDGGASTGSAPTYAYDAAGTYSVTLTVTDNGGLADAVTREVMAEAAPPAAQVTYVGSAVRASGTNNPSVTVPATTQAEDRLVLVFTTNNTASTFTEPAGVTGWTKLETSVAKTMSTTVWTKAAASGDAGATVRVPLSGAAKSTLTVGAYRGVSATGGVSFASASQVTSETTRVTPAVVAPSQSWVLSYWADKSSTTTAWSTSAPVSARQAACASSTGRICSLLADSGAGVQGAYAGVPASTDVASTTATMWSIVLTPA